MKKNIALLVNKFMRFVPALAMLLAVQSVSSTCFYCVHQPDVPEGLE